MQYIFRIRSLIAFEYQGHWVKVKVIGREKRVCVCFWRVSCLRLKANHVVIISKAGI